MNDASGVGWGPLWAVVGAVIAGLFAWLAQRTKARVDDSISVRGEWAKLTESLSQRLATVERDFAEFRQQSAKDMAELRKTHSEELEEMRRTHRAEMQVMREMNEGLQRQISQNSKSQAQLLSDPAGAAITRASRKRRGEDE